MEGEEAPRRTLRLDLRYDGTDFHGWQIQPEHRTVQGEIEAALARMLGGQVRIAGAGRTDRGVHALRQVASFETARTLPVEGLCRGLNSILPRDIRIDRVRVAPSGFHARFSAVARHYRYRIAARPGPIRRRYAWCLARHPSAERLAAAAAPLLGVHDFTSFTGRNEEGENPVCQLQRLDFRIRPGGMAVELRADRFLNRMVRMIVGTLVTLDRRGALDPNVLAEILAARNRSRALAAAPAAGLFLVGVTYPRA